MVEGVHAALKGGATLALMITGSNHISTMHKSLENEVNLITLAEVHDNVDISWKRKSMSYTLSNPDIYKFRGSNGLQNTDVNLVTIAAQLDLIDSWA